MGPEDWALPDDWINPFDLCEEVKEMPEVLGVFPTGSFFICYPQVTDTDKDYVVKVTDLGTAEPALLDKGYKVSVSDREEYDLQPEE